MDTKGQKSVVPKRIDGEWKCCGETMIRRPVNEGLDMFICGTCEQRITQHTWPNEINDPFSTENPLDALNKYQRKRLINRWDAGDFGKRYREGKWQICNELLYDSIHRWHKQEERGFFLSSSVGTGKTVAMGMMMACLSARNEFSFCYTSCLKLFSFLHNWKGWGYDYDADDLMRKYENSKYLFIDDIGVEYNSPFALSRFNELVEHRYGNMLHFVCSSNQLAKDLMNREGWGRVVDRLKDDADDWVMFEGKSLRGEVR